MLKIITFLVLVQPIIILWVRRLYVHGQPPPHPPPNANESGPPPKFYNPNYGYEPYWPGGDWKNDDDPDASSTTPIPLVCGKECHYLYRPIKKVCGRDHWKTKYGGCWNYWAYFCKGWPPDQLKSYTTFDTYCQFLDEQCKSRGSGGSKRILNRWVFIHVGACIDQDLTFKPMYYYESQIRSRMRFYLSSQADTFLSLNKTPCS